MARLIASVRMSKSRYASEGNSMTLEMRGRATVQSDGCVHVPTPGLAPGTEVDVDVTAARPVTDIDTEDQSLRIRSWMDFFGAGPRTGHSSFASPEEVDAYIREGRGPWPS